MWTGPNLVNALLFLTLCQTVHLPTSIACSNIYFDIHVLTLYKLLNIPFQLIFETDSLMAIDIFYVTDFSMSDTITQIFYKLVYSNHLEVDLTLQWYTLETCLLYTSRCV